MNIRAVYCQKCGKFYDGNKFGNCPNCLNKEVDSDMNSPSRPIEQYSEQQMNYVNSKNDWIQNDTERINSGLSESAKEANVTERVHFEVFPVDVVENDKQPVVSMVDEEIDEDTTVSIRAFKNVEENINPVVGWLVIINGLKKGTEYRLVAGRNCIGRSEESDICITWDKTISRMKHAQIVYDAKNKKYFFAEGENKNMMYVNNDVVINQVELQPYDVIDINDNKFLFVPLCSERFDWDMN